MPPINWAMISKISINLQKLYGMAVIATHKKDKHFTRIDLLTLLRYKLNIIYYLCLFLQVRKLYLYENM